MLQGCDLKFQIYQRHEEQYGSTHVLTHTHSAGQGTIRGKQTSPPGLSLAPEIQMLHVWSHDGRVAANVPVPETLWELLVLNGKLGAVRNG